MFYGKFEYTPSLVNGFTVWRPVRVFYMVALGCTIGVLEGCIQ